MLRIRALGLMIVSAGLLVGCSSYTFLSFGPASIHTASKSSGTVQAPKVQPGSVAGVPAPTPAAPTQPALTQPASNLPIPTQPAPAPQPAPSRAPVTEGDPYVVGAPALDPIDPLMPPAGSVAKVWQPLDKSVRSIAGSFKGRISVVAVDLASGARYEFRPNDRYYPASTFKLPVTLCIVQAIERGELTWDTPVAFTKPDDDTVGQGGFANVEYGTKWPVRNLVDRSLISSNNVAVKMLARTLTWDGLAKCTANMGGMVTRNDWGSTPVSAADEAAWWQTLWQMKQTKSDLAENLLRPLRQVPYYGRIYAGTPRSDLVTHKFGTFPPYEHDGAIVWGEKPYILVVMTYGGDHAGADTAIEQVARAAWNSIYAK